MEEWNYIKKALFLMTLHNTSHCLLTSFIISSLQSIMIINSLTFTFLKSPQTATQKILNVNIFSSIHIMFFIALFFYTIFTY